MNVLIIGATGTIGDAVHQTLLSKTDDYLTLFSRRATQLTIDPTRETAINGNVLQPAELAVALKNQDAVFVALSGPMDQFAQSIVTAMEQTNVTRLIFITSMGIYNEIPASVGANGNLEHNPMLQPYRTAADLIEASNLDYTILRPGWFDNGSNNYEVTHKGDPFGGHDVSINSIADLVNRLLADKQLGARESLGINRVGS
ncbi:NAD(P)-dependent oxidoreductase [Levilactobacillus bambusae]|uniref:NAD(P)-dependent oxidoreductase n=2 Tax=Levilactobacillus bambusae TaxID=2024736 RepID=A0A2V1N2F0_9LACO|nr:NAD(P)-dependent oxidoreductase [Levilactobacillus bambusae]